VSPEIEPVTFSISLESLLPNQRVLDQTRIKSSPAGLAAPNPPSPTTVPLQQYLIDGENQLLKWLVKKNHPIPGHFFPLLLCGVDGVGKTRLAESIAKRLVLQLSVPAHAVLMLSACEFRRRYVKAVHLNSLEEFRQDCSQIKILVIDGIEQLKNSLQTQAELVHLLELFDRSNRHLILTTRELPTTNGFFLPQLASRLSSGLILPIEKPGKPVRLEIVRALVAKIGMKINEAGISTVAEKIKGSVPEIFQTLLEIEQSTGEEVISAELVNSFLEKTNVPRTISVNDIAKLVAREFDVKLKDMCGKTRRQIVVDTRAVAMFLSRDLLELSYQKIGNYFGKRDHSTVRHSIHQVELKKTTNNSFCEQLTQLKKHFTP